MASIAQAESESISENAKWAIRKIVNTGQLPRDLVENNHEAIISVELFEQVREKMEGNRRKIKVSDC